MIGFLPGLTWLFFYLREDPRPEPKYLIFIVFISGIVSALFSFLIQYFLNDIFKKNNILPFNEFSTAFSIIIVFLTYAFIEEIMKFFITFFTIHNNKNFDEPIDAMIYMIVNALGFATLENVGVLTNNEIIKNSILIMFQTASLRFIGATLLHTLTSGLIGYFWAISIREFGYKKPLIFGLILAGILHTIFNLLIIIYENSFITILVLLIAGLLVLIDFEKLKYKKI
jgi:RsiW-degrading membrane proteinase PrsW (M82 family)